MEEKEHIKELRSKVTKAVLAYQSRFDDEDYQANDLLDFTEDIIKAQKRLIIALQNELRYQ